MSRWKPNDELVKAALSGDMTPMSAMSVLDRVWVVVCLTGEGWTVPAIADQLQCSVRTVQYLRSNSHHAEYAYELREKVINTDAR